MAKTMQSKMMGSVTKGKAGSRALDHPGCGGASNASDSKSLPNTSHAGGRAHKSSGGGEGKAVGNPKPKCYAQGPQGKHAGGY